MFDIANSEVNGSLIANKLNLNLKIDKTGFTRIEINDSIISNLSFLNSAQPASGFFINSRVIIKDSDFW